jgi:hypothetical protein
MTETDRRPELMVDMFPELSVELEHLLRAPGEHALAEQIPNCVF